MKQDVRSRSRSPFTALDCSLLARLDATREAKEVAQIGAVIGREFDHELLAAVAEQGEEQLAAALHQLIDAELIFPIGSAPETTYAFKHALVQDTAYGNLLKRRRQQLHARVAEEVERRFPEVIARSPELLAHHWTEADLAERTMAGRAQWEWALLVGAQRTKKRSFIAVPCLRRLSWCFWVAF